MKKEVTNKIETSAINFHLLNNCVSDPVIWITSNGEILHFNKNAEGILNLSEVSIGKSCLTLGLFDQSIVIKRAADEFPLQIEGKVYERNKKAVVFIWDLYPLKDVNQNVNGFVAIGKKKVTNEIDSSNELFDIDRILAKMPSYIYWKNLNSEYMGCNDNLARISGLKDRFEIIGKRDEDFLWGKYGAKSFREDDQTVIKTRRTHISEYDIPDPISKQTITVRTEKIPWINNDGKILGVIGVAVDITAEKKAEALERENAISAMRIETINRFCRKLLHDIRSPLSTLRMLITVLCKATLDGDSTVDLVRIRGTAYRCIRRIEAMANSLLRQYRHQGNEENPQIEPTLLMPLVVDALLEKRSTLSMEDIKLKQEMKGAHSLSSTVECFELVQIFSNLINNCAEAIAEKREKIGDKKADGVVCFKMTEKKEHVHFAISDNGCGIPQNLLEDIFLKDKTTKKEGSGIGLFHAREGIDSWGGKIWAESEDGKGATMNILLPKSETPPGWFASQIEVKKNGILAVVDDEPHLYYSMKKLIEEQGLTEDIHLVEIKTLPKFDEWYEEHKDQNPVILMDYLFYNEQRRTGLDAIKENELKNAIIVTNIYDDVFLRKECTNAGVQLIPKNIIEKIPIKII